MATKGDSEDNQSLLNTSHAPVQPQVAESHPQISASNPTPGHPPVQPQSASQSTSQMFVLSPVTAQSALPVNYRFKPKAGLVTGALQVACGGLSVILLMAAMYSSDLFNYQSNKEDNRALVFFTATAWPLWAGLLVR